MTDKKETPAGRLRLIAIVAILALHVVLLMWMGWSNSPVHNEVGHLPAGLSHWQKGTFHLYRVNPPLVRMMAALPVLWAKPVTDWTQIYDGPRSRPEFSTGVKFVELNGPRVFWLFTLARWGCIPLSLIGAWACYRWSHDLYGPHAAMISLCLWCFCPHVLGWGATITPDVGSASLGIAACYQFRKWLRQPSTAGVFGAGLMLGIAELTKSTWLILFLVWPACWAWRRLQCRGSSPACGMTSRPSVWAMAGSLLLGVYVLNIGYGFDGVGQPLGKFEFISQTLGGGDAHRHPGNRFRGTVMESIPVPLPFDYVRGLDVQKYDFEAEMWSYLRGEFRRRGWWYYYFYGLAIKTPVAILGLLLLAFFLTILSKRYRIPAWEESALLLAPGAVLFLLSSQTGFNFHIRYALPAIPFLYVAASRVGLAFEHGHKALRTGILLLASAGAAESLSVVPHSLSFFNVAVGGPTQGHWHLLDSNVDWGQDLLRLKQWQLDNPHAQPLFTDIFGPFNINHAGISSLPIATDKSILLSGWYAISLNQLHGYGHHIVVPGYQQFLLSKPVGRAGYSILIYRVE